MSTPARRSGTKWYDGRAVRLHRLRRRTLKPVALKCAIIGAFDRGSRDEPNRLAVWRKCYLIQLKLATREAAIAHDLLQRSAHALSSWRNWVWDILPWIAPRLPSPAEAQPSVLRASSAQT